MNEFVAYHRFTKFVKIREFCHLKKSQKFVFIHLNELSFEL